MSRAILRHRALNRRAMAYLFHVLCLVGVDIREVFFHMCIATALAMNALLCAAIWAGVGFVVMFLTSNIPVVTIHI